MAPFDLTELAGTLPYYGIFLLIGLGFGAVLELAGFGDSRKLAAQFYLADMTVLKVMFTAIVVAAVLIFGASSLELLDFNRVWVNPTFLVPGVVGGLVMGIGFIVGGFCPGTSIVATATLKIDGAVFLGGVGLGVLAFSETIHLFEGFWHSTYMGRFMLPELFGLPTGGVVLLLSAVALMMFFAAEISEGVFGRGEKATRALFVPKNKFHLAGAGALLAISTFFAIIGQPDASARWQALADTAGIELNNRDPYIHPAEVVEWKEDPAVYVQMLDVRSEGDFNRFHILGAKRVSRTQIEEEAFVRSLVSVSDNTLTFVISNGERDATAAWKILKGLGVPNTYIVEGGINNWLTVYTPDPCIAMPVPKSRLKDDETIAFEFTKAVGNNCYSSHPDTRFREPPTDCYLEAHPELKRQSDKASAKRPLPFDIHDKPKFTPKVKMKKKALVKGGCG